MELKKLKEIKKEQLQWDEQKQYSTQLLYKLKYRLIWQQQHNELSCMYA